ncbi:MAG: alpha/beta hydrolase [Planctomycetota bacterium]|nr:alpha/beta hydrolase [Planctomycetota bacterium]
MVRNKLVSKGIIALTGIAGVALAGPTSSASSEDGFLPPVRTAALVGGVGSGGAGSWGAGVGGAGASSVSHVDRPVVHHRVVRVDGLDIFYRESAPANLDPSKPTILLLHGFPTSSHMFRNLIPALADQYRVVAPDYPGYGNSSMPSVDEFEYSFDNLAKVVDGFTRAVGVTNFVMYVQDYGAPIGYRIASTQPQRVKGIIVQNGNAYEEGLREFWTPIRAWWKEQNEQTRSGVAAFLEIEATKWQWTHGVRDVSTISPDTWTIDQAGLDRPGNKEIQLQLFLSYATNVPLYPKWQEYFRTHQPPMLIVWGKNDHIFPAEGAEPYKRDLKNLDFNLLDTGHFALEEEGNTIAAKIRAFLRDRVK